MFWSLKAVEQCAAVVPKWLKSKDLDHFSGSALFHEELGEDGYAWADLISGTRLMDTCFRLASELGKKLGWWWKPNRAFHASFRSARASCITAHGDGHCTESTTTPTKVNPHNAEADAHVVVTRCVCRAAW